MKDRFLELVEQISELEKKFYYTPPSAGFAVPHEEEIYDVLEFQIWIQSVQMELQGIVDRTGDKFAEGTLEAAKAKFNGWQDKTLFSQLKAKLIAMMQNVDAYYTQSEDDRMQERNSPKIFISHSKHDKPYVERLVSLLDGMGLTQTQVFCSSLPGYDIPISTDIFDYLREQFLSFNLHVLFIHSRNYYQSPVSLNEMGAAWALKSKYTSLLLPNFSFAEMNGVVNDEDIAIKLDNDEIEVKDKLNQLYAEIVEEFGLTKQADIIWEQKRDRFIKDIKGIVVPTEEPQQNPESDIVMMANGLYIRKSDAAAGKTIYYCPACYQNRNKLFPIVPGSIHRDGICSNCKMHYSLR